MNSFFRKLPFHIPVGAGIIAVHRFQSSGIDDPVSAHSLRSVNMPQRSIGKAGAVQFLQLIGICLSSPP